MISIVLVVFVLSLIGGACYRLGGSKKSGDWLDFARNTKVRDLGIPIIIAFILGLLGGLKANWSFLALLLSISATMAALSTYRYFLPKPKDYLWYHYAMHGFFTSFAVLPFTIITGHWLGFIVRCVICTVSISGWSTVVTKDILEESGRGFIFCVTAPLLFI